MIIPVAVNNLYGDPAVQVDNTLQKLEALSRDPYAGPVALITKGSFSEEQARCFASVAPKRLVALVSISSLKQGGEPISVERRLASIDNLSSSGIATIGYARPLSGSPESAVSLVRRMYDAGASTVIASGFRGTTELGSLVGVKEPSISVKEMPADMASALRACDHRVFARTSCGVALALGLERSWNPYWKSPQLAGCHECPLRSTCFERPNRTPHPRGLRVLQALGYDIEQQPERPERPCSVQASNRRECPSCCTTCYLQRSGAFLLRREDAKKPNLGELSFARHILGGVHVFAPGVIDGGDPAVGTVAPPRAIGPFARGVRVRALNTWLSFSNQVRKCFGCSYCFAPYFDNDLGEHGCLPSEIMEIV